MSTTVKWLFNVSATNGPKLVPSGTLEVEAYELIDTEVAGGGGTSTVTLPAANEDLTLLMITSSQYDEPDAGLLTYTINGGATNIPLDASLCLVGKGAIEFLTAASGGSSDPAELEFTNNIGTAEDSVTITIMVGRDAVS